MRVRVVALLTFCACAPSPNKRAEQYATCETAYRNAQRITECLIMKYDWKPLDASVAGGSYDTYLAGWGRNPLYYIRGPLREPRAEMKAILFDFAMSEAARMDRAGEYWRYADSVPWAKNLNTSYHLTVVQGGVLGYSAVLTDSQHHLRCALFVNVHPEAPATEEGMPACDSLAGGR
jgi:hypothetical protein